VRGAYNTAPPDSYFVPTNKLVRSHFIGSPAKKAMWKLGYTIAFPARTLVLMPAAQIRRERTGGIG
jgi:hypothetical protein